MIVDTSFDFGNIEDFLGGFVKFLDFLDLLFLDQLAVAGPVLGGEGRLALSLMKLADLAQQGFGIYLDDLLYMLEVILIKKPLLVGNTATKFLIDIVPARALSLK